MLFFLIKKTINSVGKLLAGNKHDCSVKIYACRVQSAMGAGAEDRRHFQITGSGTEGKSFTLLLKYNYDGRSRLLRSHHSHFPLLPGSEGVRDFLLKRPAVLMMNRAGSFFSDCTVQFS
jgi:hypothetical protein